MKSVLKRGTMILFLFNFIYLSVKCQTTFNKRIDFYHTNDLCSGLWVDGDTTYFPILSDAPNIFNWFLVSLNKIDNNGDVIKGATFQKPNYSVASDDIDILANNTFFVTTTISDSTTDPYGSVQGGGVVFNKNLDSLKTKSFNDTLNYFYHARTVVKNNKITILGSTDSTCGSIGNGYYKLHLLQIDTSLNTIFQKTYNTTCIARRASSIDVAPNNGFVLCGYEQATQWLTGNTLVIKTDSLGNVIWQKDYTNMNTLFPSITAAKTNGYMIADNFIDSSYMNQWYWTSLRLLRINENGDTLWTKKIGTKTLDFSPTNVKQLSNGDFIICGSNRPEYYDNSGNLINNQMQGFLCRTDSNGNVKWFNEYKGNYPSDSGAQNYLYDVAQTSDGGFISVGWVSPTDTSSQDVWVIKVDSMGCLTPNCNGTLGVTTIQIGEPEFVIYPNPANDFMDIATNFRNCYYSVFDNMGKLVLQEKIVQSKTRIDISGFSSGLYFITLQDKDVKISKKFIKQ